MARSEPTVEPGRHADARWRALSTLRPYVGPLAAGLLIALAVARFLAVDIAGIVMNDSLGYLARSADPFESGFVVQGYRQVAYPFLLWISGGIGDIVGWDPIFGMALLQRSVLAAGIALTIWAMRWWSVPLVALFTSATFVLHADYLLPEGMLVPLCVVCGGVLAAIVLGRVASTAAARLALAAIVATSVLAASIKLQYTALLAICGAAAWLLWRDGLLARRAVLTCFLVAGGVIASLALFQSIENRHERGVFEPISERSLAEWYGAWVAVFEVDPERGEDPALAEWYDGGNLYRFLRYAQQTYPDYPERSEVLRERIDAMFDAAGTSAMTERAAAFVGAVAGGRTDDIGPETDAILAADPGDTSTRLSFNRYAWSDRMDELVRELNDGLRPGFVSFGPLFDASQRIGDDHRPAKGVIAWSSITLMLAGLAVRGRHRPAALATLVTMTSAALVLASGYIDNARYLLGPLSLVAFGGLLSLRGLCLAWLDRRAAAPAPVLPV